MERGHSSASPCSNPQGAERATDPGAKHKTVGPRDAAMECGRRCPVIGEFGDMRRYEVVRRTSRFSVVVTDGKSEHTAHLTNSGRLRDLVFPGSACLCIPKRPAKTTVRLVGVPVSDRWAVMVDPGEQSRAFVNAVASGLIPWLSGWRISGSEVACGESRIDFEICGDRRDTGYIETKSAAMLINGDTGSFPDCPTLRGRKHVKTLRRLAADHRCIAAFLVQHPDAVRFAPSASGDPVFASDLAEAVGDGLEVRATKMCLGMDGRVVLVDPDLDCQISVPK